MSTPARRSARERKSNPKYTTVGWDKDTLRALRASSESSGSSPHDDLVDDEGDRQEPIQDEDNSAVSDDDAFSIRSASSQSSEEAGFNKSHDDDDDDDELKIQVKSRATISRTQTRVARSLITNENPGTAHSRGVARDMPKSAPKETVYYDTYGPDMDDLAEVLQARDTWLNGRDITVPSRKTLSEAEQLPVQNSDFSPLTSHSPSANDAIYKSLADRQILQRIKHDHLQSRYLVGGKWPHLTFMGPNADQQKFDLASGASLDFGEAWRRQVGDNCNDAQSYHQGWILNLGEKVQTISWAPSPTPEQFLAVACRSTSTQRGSVAGHDPGAPAFSASPPYPSNIQIWKFTTEETRFPALHTLTMAQRPVLAMVVATDWGEILQIHWRPNEGALNVQRHADVTEIEFRGILGVLSSDGCARLISISIPNDANVSLPVTVRAHQAGYEISPPSQTIFTTFSFATPSDIILGAADGSIHLFDLTDSTRHNESPVSCMSYPLHNTYVITVKAASPSHLSHFISSVSASGDLVMVDLRSPEQDQISIHRSCFPNRDLVYSPLTRSFITALDRAGNTHIDSSTSTYIMCYHMRQFHASYRVAKLPDYGGTATALAASQWHPCILASNARGTVVATNFLRKVLPQTRKDLPKAKTTTGAYLQKICEYEWRPLAEDELREIGIEISDADRANINGPLTNLYHGRDVRPGASRFSEGFKPERIHVGHPIGTKKEMAKLQELGAAEATFEDEQAVTVIEWNVNRHCAGLVAIGWGSGLLRVQDLAHNLES